MYPEAACVHVSDSTNNNGPGGSKMYCSSWKGTYPCYNMFTGEKVCTHPNGASCCVSEAPDPCPNADGFVKSNTGGLKGLPGCECALSNGTPRKDENGKPICDNANSTTSLYGKMAGVLTDLYEDCGMTVGATVATALAVASYAVPAATVGKMIFKSLPGGGSVASALGGYVGWSTLQSGCYREAFGIQGDNMLVAGLEAFASVRASQYEDRFYTATELAHQSGFGTGGDNCTNPNKKADIMQLIFPYAFAGTTPPSPNMGFTCELRTRPSQNGGKCVAGEVVDKYTGYCVPDDGRWVNGNAGKYGATGCPADGDLRSGVCYCNNSSDQVYGMCTRDKKTGSGSGKDDEGYHVWVDNLDELEQNTSETVAKLIQTNNALNQIKSSVDAQKADLNSIKASADSIKTDVNKIATDVNKTAATLDSIKTLQTQSKQSLDEINTSLNTIETNSTAVKSDIEQIKLATKQSQDTLALIKTDADKSANSLQQIQQDTQAVKTATEAIKQDSSKTAVALDAIKTDVQDAKNSLNQIETESKETNTLLQQVKANSEESANSLNAIETNSKQISSDVSAIKADAQTTATALQSIKDDANKSAADLEIIKKESQDSSTALQAIKADVQGSKTALEAIKVDAEASKTALQAIKTDAEITKTTLQQVKTDLEQSKQYLSDIKMSSDKTADSLSTLKTDMQQTNTTLKDIQQDTGKTATSLKTLETTVDKANTTLTDIKQSSDKVATDTAAIKTDLEQVRKTAEEVKEIEESQKDLLTKIKEDSEKNRENLEKIQKSMDGKFEPPTLTNAPKTEQVNILSTYNSAKDVTAAGSGACVPPPELKITFKGHTTEKAGDVYCTVAKVSNIFSYVMGAVVSLSIVLQ